MILENLKKTIIWTRSREDWEEDIQFFAGLPVIHLPCISIELLEISNLPEIGGTCVVVFTSRKAVQYSFRIPQMTVILSNSKTRVYCTGEKTAAEVSRQMEILGERPFGYALGKLFPRPSPFKDFRCSTQDTILLPGPVERAIPLAEELNKQGLKVFPLDLYRTKSRLTLSDGTLPTPEQKAFLMDSLKGVVCFLSPSAVLGFRIALRPGMNRLGRNLHAVVIGETTKKACEGTFETIHVAKKHSVVEVVTIARRLVEAKA
ncbi:MAG: uroporphyrinogen-III synthase [Deltaproteobacteria bacterium]|nr:uroporphyrinogen-III synthase [Deltaproteobacteria bacterium]